MKTDKKQSLTDAEAYTQNLSSDLHSLSSLSMLWEESGISARLFESKHVQGSKKETRKSHKYHCALFINGDFFAISTAFGETYERAAFKATITALRKIKGLSSEKTDIS